MTRKLIINRQDLIDKPLWFHLQNKMQTATGYGKNLKTANMVMFNHRQHRLYYCCYSNSGTYYIKTKIGDIIIDFN